MPKRVIDFDAMWGSDKIASCAEWAQAEYAWLYGPADASGCFELTNLRVVWGRVAAIRRNLTIERLEQIFNEFQDKGLLFVWEEHGKRYGNWTGSDVPGRLPPPSWRMRLERLAPPVPRQQIAQYMSRFARGRANSPGGGFAAECSDPARQELLSPNTYKRADCGVEHRAKTSQTEEVAEKVPSAVIPFTENVFGEPNEVRNLSVLETQEKRDSSACSVPRNDKVFSFSATSEVCATGVDQGLKAGVEATHAQDWDLNLSREEKREWKQGALRGGVVARASLQTQTSFIDSDLRSEISEFERNRDFKSDECKFERNQNVKSEIAEFDRIQRSKSEISEFETNLTRSKSESGDRARAVATGAAAVGAVRNSPGNVQRGYSQRIENENIESTPTRSMQDIRRNDKAFAVARELILGQGPSSCGPVGVKPEVLERVRARDAARRALAVNGSRSP